MTSIRNSSLVAGAVNLMETWYEFVVTSLVSTVSTTQKSTSAGLESVPSMVMGAPPVSETDPALVAALQVPFGSPASSGHAQPFATGPAGNEVQPGSHAPSEHMPVL